MVLSLDWADQIKGPKTINAMANIDAEYEALCAEYALTSV